VKEKSMARKMILPAALVLLLATVATAETLHESFDRTYPASGPNAALSLSNVNGRIRISSWDQPQIRVHAEKTVRGESGERARKLMSNLRIDVSAAGNAVRIVTHSPESHDSLFGFLFTGGASLSVDYEVTVPRHVKLSVENTNGELDVNGVDGELEVETTNGRIEMTQCAGRVHAETTNGRIRAQLLSVEKEIHLETTNGSVALEVPPSFNGVLDASTTNGSIDTDFPVTMHGSHRNELQGTIGRGGPAVRLRTTNGGIEVRSHPQSR
jgi:DUF4097 and DUF4098 domain-containing protein YvlB